jgi:hypothetical protein
VSEMSRLSQACRPSGIAEILFEFPKHPNGRRLLVYVIPERYTLQLENQCDIAPKPAAVISGLKHRAEFELELNRFANMSAGLG